MIVERNNRAGAAAKSPSRSGPILVTDGFSGNVMLKTIEGVGSFMGRELKGMFMKSLRSKAAALLVKGGLSELAASQSPFPPQTQKETPPPKEKI